MKLILESWRQYLNEQKEGEGVLLYHATCSPPESFVNGINPARAKGFGQGEGFYFFTKKTRAVNHANDLIKGSVDKEEAVDCSGGAHIVISDEPVTPETFDIDYEAYAGGFSEFVIKNKEYFEPRKDNYGLGISPCELYNIGTALLDEEGFADDDEMLDVVMDLFSKCNEGTK